MGRFLHDNAMQVAGLAQIVIGIVLTFLHLTSAQTAAIATLPTGLGTFGAGLVITTKKNGSGIIQVFDKASGHTLTVNTSTKQVTGSTDRPPDTTPQAAPVPPTGS